MTDAFVDGKKTIDCKVKNVVVHWDNLIKTAEKMMNKKIAYTIGRTEAYDKSLADKPQSISKMGKCKDYEGGWIWSTAEEAHWFINNKLKEVVPKCNSKDLSVYQLKLPNNWEKDVSKETGEDGVHILLNDAIIMEKVQFIELNYDEIVNDEIVNDEIVNDKIVNDIPVIEIIRRLDTLGLKLGDGKK